jgi:hypothetical protein
VLKQLKLKLKELVCLLCPVKRTKQEAESRSINCEWSETTMSQEELLSNTITSVVKKHYIPFQGIDIEAIVTHTQKHLLVDEDVVKRAVNLLQNKDNIQ